MAVANDGKVTNNSASILGLQLTWLSWQGTANLALIAGHCQSGLHGKLTRRKQSPYGSAPVAASVPATSLTDTRQSATLTGLGENHLLDGCAFQGSFLWKALKKGQLDGSFQ